MSESVIASHYLVARHAGAALWLARYMERIENLARLLDVTKTFAGEAEGERNWLSLLRINGDGQAFFADNTVTDVTSVARFYLLDEHPTSVQTSIAYARENARTLRALISTEMWLQINVFHGRIRTLNEADVAPDQLSAVCAMLKEGVQSHGGISEGTFYRDQCWHFYMLGRHLERTDQITRLIDTKFNALLPTAAADAAIDAGEWNALLRAAAGYHAYRREYPHGYVPREVAGFLLLNGAFPRSAGLNLAQLEWHLTQLHSRYYLRGAVPALERLDNLRATVTSYTIDEILDRGLSPFLDWMQREVGALHGDIMSGLCGE